MAATILRDFAHPRVELKQTWGDAWQVQPAGVLQVLRGGNYVPSAGLDYVTLRSRYGRVKLPGEETIETREPLSIDGWWVRISVYDAPEEDGDIEGEWIVIFQGRIESQLRSPTGKMFDNPACGVQEWTAYGGYEILRKAAIHTHTARTFAGDEYELSFVASPNLPFNGRDEWFANRADIPSATPTEHFVFSADGEDVVRETWSSLDFTKYLLARHLPAPAGGANPTWTIGGQTDAIESLKEGIRVDDPTDVATVLHATIPRAYGVDFLVVPTEAGFEISVFSLATADSEFDTDSVPANPNVFSLDATTLTDSVIRIENTSVQRFRKIIVRGERLACCATFGFEATDRPSFSKLWKDDAEDGYKTAAGDLAGDADFNDTCRSSGEFEGVYQRFSADLSRLGTSDINANPRVDEDGFVRYEELEEPMGQALRTTLDWIPIRPNINYRELSPFDSADIGDSIQPGDDILFRPMVFFPTETVSGNPANYKVAEVLGIELSPLTDRVGVTLRCNPPHLIASADFDPEAAGTGTTTTKPLYDWRKMLMTIAYPGSHRIQLVSTDEDADESDGTKIIDVPGAQCWFLAEKTVYGADSGDAAVKGVIETTQPLVVRDDRPRLARVMAGAIARYRRNRYRAVIDVRGLAAWHQYLGHLIETINDGTEDTATLKSPITGVEWEFENGYRTMIRTGYAE